ncbi:unnamed protein product [Calypogeia fissa]
MEEKEMQARQQEQLKELKMVTLKEKEDLLMQTFRQQEELRKEMEDAVRDALKQKFQDEDYARALFVWLNLEMIHPGRELTTDEPYQYLFQLCDVPSETEKHVRTLIRRLKSSLGVYPPRSFN